MDREVTRRELEQILDHETRLIQQGKTIGNCGWLRHRWFIDASEWVDVVNENAYRPQDKYIQISLDVMVKHCLNCNRVEIAKSTNGVGGAIWAKRDYLLTESGQIPRYAKNKHFFTKDGKRIYRVNMRDLHNIM